MNYPFWDVGIGYGYLMAAIAVLHVFISHFAIGGGLYLVIVETRARKQGDAAMLGFLQRLSKFFALVSLVAGAITGVGIWFIMGLLNPAATEALIHTFVWGWAIEWTFFVVEVAAAILYYYGWQRMSARNHLNIGWIYFGSAWLSLVVVNGILSFMLTPGDWLKTGDFWIGFFNPTYFSSTVFRTGVSILLAGLYALLLAAREQTGDFKAKLVRYNARWAIVGLVIMTPSFWWFWRSIPKEITDAAIHLMPTPICSMSSFIWLGGVTAVLVIVFGYLLARRLHLVTALVLMLAGLGLFGSFEWFRESIRKPYAIYGYQYGNGIDVAQVPRIQADGMLAHMTFRTGNDGADLFRRACRTCHTISGYKALKPRFDGTDVPFIAGAIVGAHTMKGNMPPFVGNMTEAKAIAEYIYPFLDHRPLGQIYGLTGIDLGKKVYDIRCGKCHVIGGFNDKSASIAGVSDDDYATLLSTSGELSEFMPAYTGSDEEWSAMVQYLKTLTSGGKDAASGL